MNKKVIVTGGAGFIGSNVVKELQKKGYHVRVLDNLSKKHKVINKEVELIKTDLTDSKSSQKHFKGFDKCIHLAALIGGIGYFNKYPADILSENNKMYSTVFESVNKYNYQKIIYISSSMVFESTNIFPSKESDLSNVPMPKTSYGFSKLIGEAYCRAFNNQYSLPYVILRPFNAYGINEFPDDKVGMSHVIPDLIKKMLDGQYPIQLLGNGNQSRSFTHVLDIAKGIVMAMEKNSIKNDDFNLGNSTETKIIKLAESIHKLSGSKKEFKYKLIKGFDGDVKKRIPDVKKANKILGWKAEIKLEDALPEIYNWSKINFKSGR